MRRDRSAAASRNPIGHRWLMQIDPDTPVTAERAMHSTNLHIRGGRNQQTRERYNHSLRPRNGFTLVELLVVIAIIGILIALLLPAIQAAREAARRTECQNHLKQIGLAVQNYHDAQKTFPMGRNRTDQFGVSWAFRLLPAIEEQPVYASFDKSKPVFDNANAHAMRTPIAVYACPSRRSPAADRDFDNNDEPPYVLGAAALGDYAGNAGIELRTGMLPGGDDLLSPDAVNTSVAGPIFTGSQVSARRVTDGLSKTLAIGERHIPPANPNTPVERQERFQGDTAFLAGDAPETIFRGTRYGLASGPGDNSLSPEDNQQHSIEKFGGPHPSIVMFNFLDGHVASLSTSIDIDALKGLATIAGGEVINE